MAFSDFLVLPDEVKGNTSLSSSGIPPLKNILLRIFCFLATNGKMRAKTESVNQNEPKPKIQVTIAAMIMDQTKQCKRKRKEK
jgi:hypothetical protein